jgi:hypothetical protein
LNEAVIAPVPGWVTVDIGEKIGAAAKLAKRGGARFAPKVAQALGKAAASSTNKLAPQRWTLP